MTPRRTYILSVHEPDGNLMLEEVRTRRRVRLADFSEVSEQINYWRDQDSVGLSPDGHVNERPVLEPPPTSP